MHVQRTSKTTRRSFLLLTSLAALTICLPQISACGFEQQGGTAQANKKKAKKTMSTEPVPIQTPAGKEIATVAAGCFWCVEAIFQDLKGVEKVESGYSGGKVANPSYQEVCNGTTGHAEAIQITFDPKQVAYRDLLRIFFTTHDPTTLNRQGADVGTQYRSAVFFHSAEQKKTAEEVIREVTQEKLYTHPIVTEVTPYSNFYKAEDYHQNYYKSNPNQGYCRMVIEPKVIKFRQKYSQYLKK